MTTKRLMQEGALVKDDQGLPELSAEALLDVNHPSAVEWRKMYLDRYMVRFQHELAEAREVSKRVWESHGLLDVQRKFSERYADAYTENSVANRNLPRDFDKDAYQDCWIEIAKQFDGRIPLEIFKVHELDGCLQSITNPVGPYEGGDLTDLLYDAIRLGRSREALEIHLRDGRLLDQRRKSLDALLNNNPRTVARKERAAVIRLNKQLADTFPRKSPRYREIARRLGDKVSEPRVRYIIEGPRRKK